jgi:23S rRNA pseudouridine1911/1915/1917 synthase
MKINITIQEDHKDIRLDTLVSNFLETCSRSRAAALINSCDIRVNQVAKRPGYRVKPGDLVTGTAPDQADEVKVLPENIHLDIVFEDRHIMVINKKPGMVVHPAPGNFSGTLVNALLGHEPGIRNAGDNPLRRGIVHRLDKDTSGLMVAAKTGNALNFLQKEFKHRRVEKRYLALVYGHLAGDRGEINLPIGRHPVKRKLMTVNAETGKPARTLWTLKQQFKTAGLVEAVLKTGRTHQIRVHFYALGHPLIGDPVYQPKRFRKKKSMGARQMLHSNKLSFRHPYSGRKLFFEADPPRDFSDTMEALKSVS